MNSLSSVRRGDVPSAFILHRSRGYGANLPLVAELRNRHRAAMATRRFRVMPPKAMRVAYRGIIGGVPSSS
jgi:hypothetical protein